MTHYERLGISPESTREEIKCAFRAKALVTHPDMNRGSTREIREANREFSSLSNAYRALIDPVKRAAYDRKLAGGEPEPVGAAARAAGADRSQVMADFEELDAIRGQVWSDPRTNYVWQTVLYLLCMAPLIPLYYLPLRHLFRRWDDGDSRSKVVLGAVAVSLMIVWPLRKIGQRVRRLRASGWLAGLSWKMAHRRRGRRRSTFTFGTLLLFLEDEHFWKGLVALVFPVIILGLVSWRILVGT